MSSLSSREHQLREHEERTPTREASLLTQMFRELESDGVWHVSFADLCGLAQKIPDLHLSVGDQMHSCAFCVHAKSDASWHRDCVRNKHAANRLLLHRKQGFTGQCHLGITDIVEPLLVRGEVMGVFFYGSVIVREQEAASKEKILRYCKRRGLAPGSFLEQFRAATRVHSAELEARRERLRLVARIASRLVEAWGFPTGHERRSLMGAVWQNDQKLPATLRKAMARLHSDYNATLDLGSVAAQVGVTGDYLGALFRKHLSCTLGDYLSRVRINHARRLIETGRYSAGEVALRVGFCDQAHFGKVFKRLSGLTPGEYAAQNRT